VALQALTLRPGDVGIHFQYFTHWEIALNIYILYSLFYMVKIKWNDGLGLIMRQKYFWAGLPRTIWESFQGMSPSVIDALTAPCGFVFHLHIFLTLLPQAQGHVTQKLGQISKIRPDQI